MPLTLTELVKNYIHYLTPDKNHIKQIRRNVALNSKEDLYNILDLWQTLTHETTIGLNNNISATIYIRLGVREYQINSDSTKDGVKRFLENRNNEWERAINATSPNKFTNHQNGEKVVGFQLYRCV